MHGVQTSNPQAFLTTDYTDECRILYTKPNPALSGICTICKSADNTARKDRLLVSPHTAIKIPYPQTGHDEACPSQLVHFRIRFVSVLSV